MTWHFEGPFQERVLPCVRWLSFIVDTHTLIGTVLVTDAFNIIGHGHDLQLQVFCLRLNLCLFFKEWSLIKPRWDCSRSWRISGNIFDGCLVMQRAGIAEFVLIWLLSCQFLIKITERISAGQNRWFYPFLWIDEERKKKRQWLKFTTQSVLRFRS